MKYAAIVYQGMVTDIRIVAVGEDQQQLQEQADTAASRLQPSGEAEGYSATVVPVEEVAT